MSFTDLPNELMLHILSFLDFRDTIRCSAVCLSINTLTKDEMYWKLQCRTLWNQEMCPVNLTWREYFIQWHGDFGAYMDIYDVVRKAWNQIESFIKVHCPNIFISLNAGASDNELSGLEAEMGIRLPHDLRCVYKIHNGQKAADPPVAGLFGTVHNYDHFRNERMPEIQDMLRLCLTGKSEKHMELLRISHCEYSGISQFLCLTDEHGLEIGAIYCPSGYPAIADFSERNYFILGTSYLDWFVRYAQELTNKAFPLVKQQSQDYIYKFYQDPECVAVTDHVRVSVATAFIPEMSCVKPPHFTFAYRITMSMDADVASKHSCRLETRHWIITDEGGKTSHVNGPGVIGEHPIIKPGTTYSYVSCTNFKSRCGEMKGSYTFLNLTTSEPSEVVVPLFYMICPDYVTLEERKEKIKKRAE